MLVGLEHHLPLESEVISRTYNFPNKWLRSDGKRERKLTQGSGLSCERYIPYHKATEDSSGNPYDTIISKLSKMPHGSI